nr:hypothetical protein [Candidatus Sigynarchaeota archaeon]
MAERHLDEELKRIRTESRFQVIVLVCSLFFIFTWTSVISMILNQRTFSSEAYENLGAAMSLSAAQTPVLVIIIGIVFSAVFFMILAKGYKYSSQV